MPANEEELEDYGTLEGWSERLGVSVETLRERLAGVEGVTGQLSDGTVLEFAFYSETVVRRLCRDLFQ